MLRDAAIDCVVGHWFEWWICVLRLPLLLLLLATLKIFCTPFRHAIHTKYKIYSVVCFFSLSLFSGIRTIPDPKWNVVAMTTIMITINATAYDDYDNAMTVMVWRWLCVALLTFHRLENADCDLCRWMRYMFYKQITTRFIKKITQEIRRYHNKFIYVVPLFCAYIWAAEALFFSVAFCSFASLLFS